MKLHEINKTISDIQLGGMDAESDPELADYFITTKYVETAYNGNPHNLLGRKGSGKSSIFTQMPRLVDQYRPGTKILQITPDMYAWEKLSTYAEAGIGEEQAHTNAWKFTLGLEIGLFLAKLDYMWAYTTGVGLKKFTKFVGRNFNQYTSNNLSGTSSALSSLSSFNVGAFGFSAGASKRERGSVNLTPAITEAMLQTIRPALEEVSLIVALDRLDDAWDGSDKSKSLLVGLLKAAKEINDSYRQPRGIKPRLRVVTFLRNDIYDTLLFDDKDKHRPFEQQITWNETTLRNLVTKRLPAHVEVDDLFEDGKMRGSVKPFDHILKRTFLRPREVLQFVDLCLQEACGDATEITKENVRSAEMSFSNWKVEDLKQEYKKSEPTLPVLIEALRQELHRYDSIEEIIEVLRAKEPELVQDLGERPVLQKLFESSVIGIRVSGTGATQYRATSPTLSLPAAGAVYVHQGLHKGLNITETRKSSDSQDANEENSTIELF